MIEIDETFSSLSEWQSWAAEASNAPLVASPSPVTQHIIANGFTEPLTGRRYEPQSISPHEANLREGLVAGGMNSRMRAVLALIEEKVGQRYPHDVRIFGAEAVTPFALILRGVFCKYLGAEYAKNEAAKRALYPIPHQDLTALSLPAATFDLVTTNEVLEHVPSPDAALREIARILVPGGWHVGTFPFAFNWDTGDVRAKMVRGNIVHLKPEERHGNPVDPDGGSLVFEIPGWDILGRARKAGFSKAHMRFVASGSRGYVTSTLGVFVFCAQR